tara:strand:+ start:2886 stop:3143 length:258 start_codon:yes stop_codon:yes gene_type:complete
MNNCAEECVKKKKSCRKKSCRKWIDYKQDLNCTEIAVQKNGAMTLKEVGKRLNLSYVRITQLEKAALQKMGKKAFTKDSTNYYNE